VYISPLWHKLVVVAVAAPCDPILIYMEECHVPSVYFSLVAQAAGSSRSAHRVDPILIYTWRECHVPGCISQAQAAGSRRCTV
jgi:hypothetical protein